MNKYNFPEGNLNLQSTLEDNHNTSFEENGKCNLKKTMFLILKMSMEGFYEFFKRHLAEAYVRVIF